MAAIINPAASSQRLDQQRFTGHIVPTPDFFIRAQLKGVRPYTVIEFHPKRLGAILAKYPDGLVYQKNAPK